MPIDRMVLRAALRLHDIYVARAVQASEQCLLDQLKPYDHALDEVCAVLRQFARANMSVRTFHLRRQLRHLVQTVHDAVTRFLSPGPPIRSAVPDIRTLLAELQQLKDEFENVEVDCRSKSLSVTTDAITLEGVYLGPFTIRLNWIRLSNEPGSHCFELDALEPNPSASTDEVVHPHVRDGGLCAGDASVPIRRALEQGRLADAFLLVRHVLLTYNPSSAFVTLDSWSGSDCERCGHSVSEEHSVRCAGCERELCMDCTFDCAACEIGHCRACLIECEECDDLHCENCLSSDAHACHNDEPADETAVDAQTTPAATAEPTDVDPDAVATVNTIPNPENFHATPELIPA